MSPSGEPRRRADAQRNRARILAAAREAFDSADADVSMASIARTAGVGPGTLYRNFPDRRSLIEALYVSDIDALCDEAVRIAEETPGLALAVFLRRFYAYFTSKRAVAAELLTVVSSDAPVFGAGLQRVLAVAAPLVDAAHASGELRRDLTLEQVLELVAAVAKIPGDGAHRAPILDAVLDALGRTGHDPPGR